MIYSFELNCAKSRNHFSWQENHRCNGCDDHPFISTWTLCEPLESYKTEPNLSYRDAKDKLGTEFEPKFQSFWLAFWEKLSSNCVAAVQY